MISRHPSGELAGRSGVGGGGGAGSDESLQSSGVKIRLILAAAAALDPVTLPLFEESRVRLATPRREGAGLESVGVDVGPLPTAENKAMRTKPSLAARLLKPRRRWWVGGATASGKPKKDAFVCLLVGLFVCLFVCCVSEATRASQPCGAALAASR